MARKVRNSVLEARSIASAPLTVRLAAETYLDWLTAKNPRTAADTRGRLNRYFLPKFGSRLVASLTKTMLDGWLASIVRKSDDIDRVRRSKDSANRVLTMVKALLNHAMRDPSNGLSDDSSWRLVKPFHGVSKPRDIRYTDEEVGRLIGQTEDAAVANLITGASALAEARAIAATPDRAADQSTHVSPLQQSIYCFKLPQFRGETEGGFGSTCPL